jgi:hypothetical protein
MGGERGKRLLAGAGGFALALAAVAVLGAAGVVRLTAPGGPRPVPDQSEGFDLADEDATVRGLTFRRGWCDVELRVRYGEEWFAVEPYGGGRRLLAEAVRLSRRRYAAEQLGGSVVVLQCGNPAATLRWKVRLELDTPDGRRTRQSAAALSLADLERAVGRPGRAAQGGGEQTVGLLGFTPVAPGGKPVAVELAYRPVDVAAIGAGDGPEER